MAPSPAGSTSGPIPRAGRTAPAGAFTVAGATFGALALVMGFGFSAVALRRAPPPTIAAVMEPDGSEALMAVIDVPEGAAARGVRLDALRLRTGPGADQVVEPDVARVAALLDDRGVFARARLPREARGRAAAMLPPAIALLGALALGIAAPALVTRRRAVVVAGRAFAIGVTLALAALAAERGFLTWPGLAELRRPAAALSVKELIPPPAAPAPKRAPSASPR
jgi:hypothetical protein